MGKPIIFAHLSEEEFALEGIEGLWASVLILRMLRPPSEKEVSREPRIEI